ncbi:MAG: transposase, partial [Lentisphaeria bacterium]|nr:transposase [Lentisphaeria bacterium]
MEKTQKKPRQCSVEFKLCAILDKLVKRLFKKLPVGVEPLLHSDQGWQYQMNEYCRMLKAHNITQSMSRKGNCLDNSVMENFFGRLKTEMFFGETFASVEDFKQKLEEYICYFNN